MLIADVITLITAQVGALGAGVVDVMEVVLPIALGLVVFYFAYRKIRGAVK